MNREPTTAALCAKAIRQELKQKIPNVQFRVVCENFSGGNSVDVYYTDGPKAERVEEITNKYHAGSFDGMNDLYTYDNRNDNLPQVKYLFVKREMSDSAKAAIIASHNKEWGPDGRITDVEAWNAAANCWNSSVIWGEFNKLDLTAPTAATVSA